MERIVNWITSAGGPLILLAERELENWGGVVDTIKDWPGRESYSPGGQPTDYDRAGAVHDYLGRIPVGPTLALVIADEPLPTAWVPAAGGGTIVGLYYSESDDPPLQWLDTIPEELFREDGTFNVEEGRLFLFDSALAGRNVKNMSEDFLVIELKPGVYQIATALYKPDSKPR